MILINFFPHHLSVFQVVPCQYLLQPASGESHLYLQHLRSLAFSCYSQCRRLLPQQTHIKSLTGFGPVSTVSSVLTSPEVSSFYHILHLYCYMLSASSLFKSESPHSASQTTTAVLSAIHPWSDPSQTARARRDMGGDPSQIQCALCWILPLSRPALDPGVLHRPAGGAPGDMHYQH